MRFHAGLAAAVAVALATPALAQTPIRVALDQTPHLCGGVGENTRAQAEAFPHTLKLVFAEPDGHYLADVATRITDAAGNQVLNTTCDGPWLLTDLPNGHYQVEATYRGRTKSVPVSINGPSEHEQVITFPASG